MSEAWPSSLAHAREQIIALRADNERLRKEVAELLDALSLPCPTCGDTREDTDARAALEPAL